jgi:hypothetical protein
MGVVVGDAVALAAHHPFGVDEGKDKGGKARRDVLAYDVGVADF